MPNLAWNEKLNLGISGIDLQHKQLIRLSNRFLVALRNGREVVDLKNIFHELSEYTVHHFDEEEAHMRRLGYPKLAEHHELHVQLKRDVREFQSRIFHQDAISPEEVKGFLKRWLLDHILHHDMDIAKYKARVDHEERIRAENMERSGEHV